MATSSAPGGYSPRPNEANITSNTSSNKTYQKTESGNWPSNFPKIPPPKGMLDDADLERMAAHLMRNGAGATAGGGGAGGGHWEAQPGWTRQTQQSYTIETVVEKLPPDPAPYPVAQQQPYPPSQQRVPNAPHQTAPGARPKPSQQQQQEYWMSKSVGYQPASQVPRGQPQAYQAQRSQQQVQAVQPTQQRYQPTRQQAEAVPAAPQVVQQKAPEKGPQPTPTTGQWSQFTQSGGMDYVPQQQQQQQGQPQQRGQQMAPPQVPQKGQQQQQPLQQQEQQYHQIAKQQPQQPQAVQREQQQQQHQPAQQQQNQRYYQEEYEWSEQQGQKQPQVQSQQQPQKPEQPQHNQPEQQQQQMMARQPQPAPQQQMFQRESQQQQQQPSQKWQSQSSSYSSSESRQNLGQFAEQEQKQQQQDGQGRQQGPGQVKSQQQQQPFGQPQQPSGIQKDQQQPSQQDQQVPEQLPDKNENSAMTQQTTIFYEQKVPPQQPVQQQKEPFGQRAQDVQNVQQRPVAEQPQQQQQQRRVQVVQQQQQPEGAVQESERDEPPPEMQLAQADPDVMKEHQQQQQMYNYQPSAGQQNGGAGLLQFQQSASAGGTRPNYQEPLYVLSSPQEWDGGVPKQYSNNNSYQQFQPQKGSYQYYSPSSAGGWEALYGDEWVMEGNPPSFTTGPAWGDHLAYAQKVNLERRRAESEERRRHHSPVPGSAEHGYLFGGMDFVDHQQFDPQADVGEPWPPESEEQRRSRRDLHWGPPRRRGDFFGLDYITMLPGDQQQLGPGSAEDAQYYHGYQPLTPRKNFRLCGHITADPDSAQLNIAEAQGLNELDSQYWVGDTLSNQKILFDHPLSEEEKRTFALLYGPGGFKPEHRTVRPEPKPEEPVQFSVTIGPRKEYQRGEAASRPEGYVNPMKVEGESWILGNRENHYGGHPTLHSSAQTGDHLPFQRPRQFPAHVPQWARQRMQEQQQGRGARSLDRSLFAPAWTRVPQPQPPFWVKRDGSGAAGGFQWGGGGGAEAGQQRREPKQQQEEEEKQQQQQEGQAVQSRAEEQQQQQEFEQFTSQQSERPEGQQQKTLQKQPVGKQQQQQAQKGAAPQQSQQVQQPGQGQKSAEAQQKPVVAQNVPQQQKQSQQEPAQAGPKQGGQQAGAVAGEGGSFSQKKQQIHQQPRVQLAQQQPQQKQQVQREQRQAKSQPQTEAQWKAFSQFGGMDYAPSSNSQLRQQDVGQEPKQPQQQSVQFGSTPSYQLIVNPPKSQGRVQPAKQPLTQRQEQQQQAQQQQQYYQFYEGKQPPQPQQQAAMAPRQAVPAGAQAGSGQDQQQHQPSQQRLWTVKRSGPRIVQQSGEVPLSREERDDGSGLENLAAQMKLGEFPLTKHPSLEQEERMNTGRNNSNNMFVDAHGRPVQYVRETKLDPSSGQPVTREEWRLVEQQQQPKMQTPTRTAAPGQAQAKGGQPVQQAQWNQFTRPGGMDFTQQ